MEWLESTVPWWIWTEALAQTCGDLGDFKRKKVGPDSLGKGQGTQVLTIGISDLWIFLVRCEKMHFCSRPINVDTIIIVLF